MIRTVLLIAVASLAVLALAGCARLLPDVEDWIADSETLARRFDARLDDLSECVEEDDCEEALGTETGAFAMCSWVTSRGTPAPEGFEAAEWQRFDALCEGLEGLLELPEADALRRIEDLQAETDRISEGIRADIEPREQEEAKRDERSPRPSHGVAWVECRTRGATSSALRGRRRIEQAG